MGKVYTNKDFRVGLIYKYTSPSGKVYIGQTINERSRKYRHKLDASKGKTHFARALNKYGYDNFKYDVIIKFKPTVDIKKLKRVLNKLEQRYIKLYNSVEEGYNLTFGGVANSEFSELSKKKMSESAKEKFKRGDVSEAQLATWENFRNYSKNITDEQKEERSKKLRSVAKNKIEVWQYDLDDNFIQVYESMRDAARSITNYKSTLKTKTNRISECCSGKRVSIYGYKWTIK